MEIINKKINELIPYINNPRKNDHAVDKVASSIKNFGFKVPIIIDGKNEIVTGHTRLKAAQKLGLKEVPCIVADDLTDAQVKAFRIADNRVTEEAEWDWDLLKIEIESIVDINIDDLGFNEDEIKNLFKEEQNEVIEDDAPDPPENPISKRGDIWLLGRHRLMCGDSTSEEDVNILMNGNKAHMCFTDPPYNVSIGTIKHPKFKQREIENDSMSKDDFKIFVKEYTSRIKENTLGCVYIAGPQGEMGRVMFIEADEQMHCSTTIIWNKDQFTLGRGKYQNKYEPIWFGWVENGSRFSDKRTLVNVWDIPRPKKSDLHPTMKPIELVVRAINDASLKSDIVLDLFGGSGSTLIACEQTERINYSMELDPKYVDVIVNRYINFKESEDDVFLIRDGNKIKYSEVLK